MSDHGLTPVRPRTTPLEATILDQLRELRERVAKLEAKASAARGTLVKAAREHDREEFAHAYTKIFGGRGGTLERGREVFDLMHDEDRLTDILHAVVVTRAGVS